MPMAVLSNFLIYCVVNAFTPGPGNILALNTITNYGYKIEDISLDLHNSQIEGNIETEYEKKFSENGNKIYYLHAKKDV